MPAGEVTAGSTLSNKRPVQSLAAVACAVIGVLAGYSSFLGSTVDYQLPIVIPTGKIPLGINWQIIPQTGWGTFGGKKTRVTLPRHLSIAQHQHASFSDGSVTPSSLTPPHSLHRTLSTAHSPPHTLHRTCHRTKRRLVRRLLLCLVPRLLLCLGSARSTRTRSYSTGRPIGRGQWKDTCECAATTTS